LKVMGRNSIGKVEVAADATGLTSRAGTALLALVAQRLGLIDGLGGALAGTRDRRSAHDPGAVFCDLAVMLADGGRCVSDVAALAGQPALFGEVASVSTARRVVLSVGERELDRTRQARAKARERAWAAGAAPERVIIDFDATPVTSHSEKELAAGHYKGGFGFHPLAATCGREVLAGILRPGNAGANNAEDHLALLDLALEQLPTEALEGEILARADAAGANHRFAEACRETDIRFSLGYGITEPVRKAILGRPESVWKPAVNADGKRRQGAWVAELTGQVNLQGWPAGTRLICRRERPHPGAQLSFSDHDGHRFQCFITDQDGADLTALEATHRQHAKSKIASRRSRRPAPRICPSQPSPPTRHGLNSRSSRTTSPSGPNSSASTQSTPSASQNDCAIASCTSPGSSPATPDASPCTSPPTGPGQPRSNAPSTDSQRCPSTANRRRSRPAQPDARPRQPARDSACPQTPHTSRCEGHTQRLPGLERQPSHPRTHLTTPHDPPPLPKNA